MNEFLHVDSTARRWLLHIAHKLSRRFTFGEFPGQLSTCICCSVLNFFTTFEVWRGLDQLQYPSTVRIQVFKLWNNSFVDPQYIVARLAFLLLAACFRHHNKWSILLIIFFCGCLIHWSMWTLWSFSLSDLRTCWLRWPCSKKWLSLVKRTFLHRSFVYALYFFAHLYRFSFIVVVKAVSWQVFWLFVRPQ